MRWLIISSYPPERGQGARAAFEFVSARIDAGDTVHVVSPRPSVAHDHRDLVGRDALRWMKQALASCDAIWVRIEPGVVFTREPSRLTALVERFLLGRILRAADRSVIDVGDASMLPGGRAGALVFGSVDEVVVHSVAERDAMVSSGASVVTLVPHQSAPGPARVIQQDASPVTVDHPALAPISADARRDVLEATIRSWAVEAPISRVD